MEVWNENIISLKKMYPVIAEAIQENKINKKAEDEILDICIDGGEHILAVQREGYRWRLNSMLNPMCAAEIYAERYTVRAYNIFFVFGFSDGRHVRELLKKCDRTNRIIVVEPKGCIFQKALELFAVSDILEDNRVSICVLDIENTLDTLLKTYLDYSNVKLVEFCILPAYDILYPQICEKIIQKVIEEIDHRYANENTYKMFDRTLPRNTLYNMQKTIFQRNFVQIRQAVNKFGWESIPVIIVAAGPSLDKNIHDLKKAQGKAFIIVVDAALRTVLNEGIQPDFVCSIDPNVPKRFFEGLNLKDLNWCCDRQSQPWVLEHGQNVIYYHGWFGLRWNTKMAELLGYEYPVLPPGGSVSAEAFQVACALGFQKIIFIGQDLAFTGGVSHTKGIAGALGDNDEYIKNRQLETVVGINGEILQTDYQMAVYRRWFERRIEEQKDCVTVIDATEGGAKIEGTLIQTLSETIEKECVQEADFYTLLREIPPEFEERQQEILKQELCSLKTDMQEFKQTLDTIIVTLTRQKRLLKTNPGNVSMIKSVLQHVLSLNQKYSEDALVEWLVMYSQEEEHKLKESIYMDENIEPLELLNRTLKLYQSYRNSIDLFLEDYEKYIQETEITV